jgi:23S rRNA pseudouridine2605 synthase
VSPDRPRRRPAPPRARSLPEDDEPAESPADGERLQRILARAGFGSRRSTEDLIREGRVAVNGRVARLGGRADPAKDAVTVDGAPVASHPRLRFLAFNKPPGVTSTMRDPHAATSLASFIPDGPRVFPVGRLDRDSEGLMLFTNDGTLAHRLQHPRHGIEREYIAEVEGSVSKDALAQLARGVVLEDGPARALRVGPVHRAKGRSALALVMGEGRKREIRRMLEAVGFPVRRLVRTRFGPVQLGDLRPGKVRPLAPMEVTELYRLTGLPRAEPGKPPGRG